MIEQVYVPLKGCCYTEVKCEEMIASPSIKTKQEVINNYKRYV